MSESVDIRQLTNLIESQSGFVTSLTNGMSQRIVGQKHLVNALLIGLLSDTYYWKVFLDWPRHWP